MKMSLVSTVLNATAYADIALELQKMIVFIAQEIPSSLKHFTAICMEIAPALVDTIIILH